MIHFTMSKFRFNHFNLTTTLLLITITFLSLSFTDQLFSQYNNASEEASTVGGLGFKVSYITPDLGKINESVSDFGLSKLDDNFLTYGGQLFGELTPGISLGIGYNFGFTETSGVVDFTIEDDVISLNRKIEYNLNYGGFLFQINRPMNKRLSLFSEFSANYGSVNLLVSQGEGNQSFSGMWHSFDPNSNLDQYNRSVNYETDLYLFEVVTGVKYTFKQGLGVILSTGYIYSFTGTEGSVNYGFNNVLNVPDLSIKSLSYSIMIVFSGEWLRQVTNNKVKIKVKDEK